MRTLSPAGLTAVLAHETDEVFVPLLTIDNEVLASPVRVAASTENVISNGETYLAYPFEITLPTDRQGQVPRGQLVIDNVDRQIVEALDAIRGPARVTIQIVRISEPDVVELNLPNLYMFNTSGDVDKVTGVLSFIDERTEPFPAASYTPARFPAGFPG